jgi:hypothetical protein
MDAVDQDADLAGSAWSYIAFKSLDVHRDGAYIYRLCTLFDRVSLCPEPFRIVQESPI